MRCKLTLMIDWRDPHWVSTIRSTDFGNVRRNRLEREGHVSSSGGTNSERFLPPEPVDLFVQCHINLSGCSTVIVTLNTSVAGDYEQ